MKWWKSKPKEQYTFSTYVTDSTDFRKGAEVFVQGEFEGVLEPEGGITAPTIHTNVTGTPQEFHVGEVIEAIDIPPEVLGIPVQPEPVESQELFRQRAAARAEQLASGQYRDDEYMRLMTGNLTTQSPNAHRAIENDHKAWIEGVWVDSALHTLIEVDACRACHRPIGWVQRPGGGWWAHFAHMNGDDHEVDAPVPFNDTLDTNDAA
jgi:hypothetical protein